MVQGYILLVSKKLTYARGCKMESIKTITLGNFTAKIIQDESPESPREWDNLGTMVCEHKRYSLGDSDHGVDLSNCNSWSDHTKAIKKVFGRDCILLPIYMLDHSGQTVSTTPFSCPWDSGRVGSIVVSRDTLRKEWGMKRITQKSKTKFEDILKGEVSTYDQYLTGDVYGYQITKDGEDVEDGSCWGYYGLDNVLEEVGNILIRLEEINQKPKCNCITGLASLEEEDEFVIVREGDGIDFEAGSNMKFEFCPMCGCQTKYQKA